MNFKSCSRFILRQLRKYYHFFPLTSQEKNAIKGFILKKGAFFLKSYPIYRNWLNSYPPPENKRRPLYLTSFFCEETLCLPQNRDPLVSVVIPVRNQLEFTHCCLSSIAVYGSAYPFETIIIDDASSDGTAEHLSKMPGVQRITNKTRKGFVYSCNKGAAKARGRYLLFLSNDTEVTRGWLDELVRTFLLFPDAGLVGPQLVFPDGRLQDAGTAIGADGSIESIGRYDSPDRPEYRYLREVDSFSGAPFFIPHAFFQKN